MQAVTVGKPRVTISSRICKVALFNLSLMEKKVDDTVLMAQEKSAAATRTASASKQLNVDVFCFVVVVMGNDSFYLNGKAVQH